MKKLILFLFVFLSFTVFSKEDGFKKKIELLKENIEFIQLDENRLNSIKKKYFNVEEERDINETIKGIFSEYQTRVSKNLRNWTKTKSYYETNDKGELIEIYKLDSATFLNNFKYSVLNYDGKDIKIIDSMDRTQYLFSYNPNSDKISGVTTKITDHIEQIGVYRDLIDKNNTKCLYKVYKKITMFFPTGEKMFDADFVIFYSTTYEKGEKEDVNHEIAIGFDGLFEPNLVFKKDLWFKNPETQLEELVFYNCFEFTGNFIYRCYKYNVFLKNGQRNTKVSNMVNINNPIQSYVDDISYLLQIIDNDLNDSDLNPYNWKIDNMLKDKTIVEIDKDRLYDSYTNNNEIKKIDRDIINECISLYQDKTIPDNTHIAQQNGIYYLLENQDYIENGRKADGKYLFISDIHSFDKGELIGCHKYTNYKFREKKQPINGSYTAIFFDNIIYDKFKNLDSMDRTSYEFQINNNKNLESCFIYINDHIEQIAICSKLLRGYREPVTVIIYKIYKTLNIFYPTGELMVDANFEGFSNRYYYQASYPHNDPKISIGEDLEILYRSFYHRDEEKDFTHKVNKFNVYNKDGTIMNNIQDQVNINDPFSNNYIEIIQHLLYRQ